MTVVNIQQQYMLTQTSEGDFIKVTICNHQADSLLYVWPEV